MRPYKFLARLLPFRPLARHSLYLRRLRAATSAKVPVRVYFVQNHVTPYFPLLVLFFLTRVVCTRPHLTVLSTKIAEEFVYENEARTDVELDILKAFLADRRRPVNDDVTHQRKFGNEQCVLLLPGFREGCDRIRLVFPIADLQIAKKNFEVHEDEGGAPADAGAEASYPVYCSFIITKVCNLYSPSLCRLTSRTQPLIPGIEC
jgi:hypothetical protein